MTWRSAVDLQNRQQQLRTALDEALGGLTEAEADALTLLSGRAIREMLAHLVLTEEAILDDLRLILAVEHPELPSIAGLDDPARLRARAESAGTLDNLVRALETACGATLAFVEALDEAQEMRTGHSPELGNVLLCSHGALNITYHYLGHVEEMHTLRRQFSPFAEHSV